MSVKKPFSSGKRNPSDPSDTYANMLDNFIEFTSTISGESVKFKAFLTEFEDQFSSEWNSEQVYGRNDPIQTFKNTTRKISLGWDSPAFSLSEGRDNMLRSAKLIRMLYPSYENRGSVSTINKSTLIKVKFRNLIKNYEGKALLVTLESVNFSPDLEAGWFERDYFNPGSQNQDDELVPKLLKFSCSMTVLHIKTIGHFGTKWSSKNENFPNLPRNLGGIEDPDFEKSFDRPVFPWESPDEEVRERLEQGEFQTSDEDPDNPTSQNAQDAEPPSNTALKIDASGAAIVLEIFNGIKK